MQHMYMPYIEGPKWTGLWMTDLTTDSWNGKLNVKIYWIVNWQCYQKQENAKKVVAWSGDFGIDQYVSWCLPPEHLCLEMIWNKFKEFCKAQTNKVRARFDLLTSFGQGDMSVGKWYNVVQAQINLAKYPAETAKIPHRDIFWFFLGNEEFVS